jgi:hypothetical protein
MNKVVATIGLHGSASTWVFNVARELMIGAAGEDRMLARYGETMTDLPDEAQRAGKFFLLKSHHGSPELDAWLAAASARVVLSVRDPRDACLSMAQRFNAELARAVHWLVQDCNRLARLKGPGQVLLRYEDRFFDQPAAVAQLAAVIGIDPDPAACAAIFARYQTAAVREFAQTMNQLPPGRVTQFGDSLMDPVTQIHRTHIGDARSGKWRDLPSPVQAELTRVFTPFLDLFGYKR